MNAIERILNDHLYTGEPGQHDAIKLAAKVLLQLLGVRPPAPSSETMKVAEDWYTYGFQSGMEAERKSQVRRKPSDDTIEDLINDAIGLCEPENADEKATEYTRQTLRRKFRAIMER
jgi:hypothetical protein